MALNKQYITVQQEKGLAFNRPLILMSTDLDVKSMFPFLPLVVIHFHPVLNHTLGLLAFVLNQCSRKKLPLFKVIRHH